MFNFIRFLGSLCILSLGVAQAGEPLFALMEGKWQGAGEVHQGSLPSYVKIEIQTDATIEGDQLLSRNAIRETPIDASGVAQPPKVYRRDYWMRKAVAGAQDTFELGAMGSTKVESVGTWNGNALVVTQDLQPTVPGVLVMKGTTEFLVEGGQTVWEQILYFQGVEKTHTHVVFQKTP